MNPQAEGRWLQPGDPAPSFVLPTVNRDGTVSLDDYRGRSPLLLGLFRGLHCPFCRRQLVQLGTTREKLQALGVETLAVVNTPPERARLYFSYRPTRVLLAADPVAATHRAFGVPAFEVVQDDAAASWPWRMTIPKLKAALINPTGELSAPLDGFAANTALNALEGFTLTDVDQQIVAAHGTQLAAHFLIDRSGVIRWAHVEAGTDPTDIGRFPSDDEILAAAGALPR
jgi:peroxiredoxin